MNHPPLVIAVGYSVRSLVEACSRASLDCVAVDHFGDADTRALANGGWIQLELVDERFLTYETLSAIEKITSDLPSAQPFAFLLAGGMENLGEAVEQLRAIGTVLGPTENQRSKLRDWMFLQAAARAAGIEFPNTVVAEAGEQLRELKCNDSWLWKPLRGAGGLKIVRAEKSNATHDQGYWQQFIIGRQLGITCVLQSERCVVVGATQSLAATDWPGPSEFIYRGSIGPIALTNEAHRLVINLCVQLQRQLGFSGLLQFDFIQDATGRLWLLECNPRWTAGMEVLLAHCENGEQTRDLIYEAYLANSLLEGNVVAGRKPSGNRNRTFAKAVVYAEHKIHVTEQTVRELQLQIQSEAGGFSWLADIPHSAQTIELGHPIATVRASLDDPLSAQSEAETRSQLLLKLRSYADRLHALLSDKR